MAHGSSPPTSRAYLIATSVRMVVLARSAVMVEQALCEHGLIWMLVWLPAAATAAMLCVLWRCEKAAAWRAGRTLCARCDYDLAGLAGTVCPECGAAGLLPGKRFPD